MNEELSFLDIINLMSFVIGLQNLDLNLTQDSLDKQTAEIDERVNAEVSNALITIHTHLEEQDRKINLILELLKEIKDERL